MLRMKEGRRGERKINNNKWRRKNCSKEIKLLVPLLYKI